MGAPSSIGLYWVFQTIMGNLSPNILEICGHGECEYHQQLVFYWDFLVSCLFRIDSITITVYCVVGFMFVVAIMLLGVGYLSTGSTRSSYVCRFKTRKSGRCQTNLVSSSFKIFLGQLSMKISSILGRQKYISINHLKMVY